MKKKKDSARIQVLLMRVDSVKTIVDARQLASEIGFAFGDRAFEVYEVHSLWVHVSNVAGWVDGEETRSFLRGVAAVIASYEQSLSDQQAYKHLLDKVRRDKSLFILLGVLDSVMPISDDAKTKRVLKRMERLGLVDLGGVLPTLTARGFRVSLDLVHGR